MKSVRIMTALLGVLLCAAPVLAEDGFVTFTEDTPYASAPEIMRRMGTPPGYRELVESLAAKHQRLSDHFIQPAEEQFFLHVPPEMPEGGYNLLVFVWPWDNVVLPRGWARVLEKHGTILVSANRSGNDQRIESRRAPLALIAMANVMKRYPINKDHVYVGGLSGGSRTAERLALAYPDLFHGAILNAGADPLEMIEKPPEDLYARFLETGHLIFITGEQDTSNLIEDTRTMASLREHCMFRYDDYKIPNLPHAVLPPQPFDMALRSLLDPPAPNVDRVRECRAKAR